MSGPVGLYEGRVSKVETVKEGKWTLVRTEENEKPLAFLTSTIAAPLPEKGDRVSAEAHEASAWWFAEDGVNFVVTKEPAPYPVESLPNAAPPERTDAVSRVIMAWLRDHRQVTADDVHDAARLVDPRADPRFIGHGFRALASRGLIRKVGMTRSRRVEKNHSRDTAVWERVEVTTTR